VQNFSYVFQSSEDSTKSITREEMRAFKKIWADLADPKSGHLLPDQFGRFFSVRALSVMASVRADYLQSD
jgi:voltage-dependent calcium channel